MDAGRLDLFLGAIVKGGHDRATIGRSFLLLFLSLGNCPWAPDSYQLKTFICHA